MATDRAGRARVLWRLVEPVHAVTYFSPEPLAALRAAGYRGFWMGYFAGRAAPLGPVGPDLVHALFYNFTYDHVARALPDAWDFAPPEAALAARLDGSVAALRRHLGDGAQLPGIERAAELASRAVASAPTEGRPLFAANRTLPEPDEPLARLWYAATLLREHRGDGHVASLVAAGVGGRESHVFHAIASGTPAETYAAARNLGPEEWDALLAALRERGWVDDADALTAAGRAAKRDVEDRTDAAAWSAYEQLGDDELDDLVEALRPVTAAVVASGEIPVRSPMGLDLSTAVAGSGDG